MQKLTGKEMTYVFVGCFRDWLICDLCRYTATTSYAGSGTVILKTF